MNLDSAAEIVRMNEAVLEVVRPEEVKPHITFEKGFWRVYIAGHEYACIRRFGSLVDFLETKGPGYFGTLVDGLKKRDVIGLFEKPILRDREGCPRRVAAGFLSTKAARRGQSQDR
ncbi:MAG: hypothetical protein PW999_00630 [Paraburkholderia tropica]|nr:hypothetical protein [Paraburkholderia tropica]